MFGDKVSDDRIHGRIFPDTRRVNQHNTALEKMTKNIIVYFRYDMNVYTVPRILSNAR